MSRKLPIGAPRRQPYNPSRSFLVREQLEKEQASAESMRMCGSGSAAPPADLLVQARKLLPGYRLVLGNEGDLRLLNAAPAREPRVAPRSSPSDTAASAYMGWIWSRAARPAARVR